MYRAHPGPRNPSPAEMQESATKARTPKAAALARMKRVQERMRLVTGFLISDEERAARELYTVGQHLREIVQGIHELKTIEKVRRESKRTKGSIMSDRGTYIEDALITAQWARVNLDSGSDPIGNGRFNTVTGQFVPDIRVFRNRGEDIPMGNLGDESTVMIAGQREFVGGPVNQGPKIPGDGFMRFGKGRPPNTDISRGRYMQEVPPHERDKDARGVGYPITRTTTHPDGCGCKACKLR